MKELTLVDLMELLKQQEETYLVELLNLTSEDIVDRFADVIENDALRLSGEIEEFGGEDPFGE